MLLLLLLLLELELELCLELYDQLFQPLDGAILVHELLLKLVTPGLCTHAHTGTGTRIGGKGLSVAFSLVCNRFKSNRKAE